MTYETIAMIKVRLYLPFTPAKVRIPATPDGLVVILGCDQTSTTFYLSVLTIDKPDAVGPRDFFSSQRTLGHSN